MQETNALLIIEDLSVQFRTKRGPLQAVSEVSITVHENESLAVIGESGSGKTTWPPPSSISYRSTARSPPVPSATGARRGLRIC